MSILTVNFTVSGTFVLTRLGLEIIT